MERSGTGEKKYNGGQRNEEIEDHNGERFTDVETGSVSSPRITESKMLQIRLQLKNIYMTFCL